jgi:hypothetical protein
MLSLDRGHHPKGPGGHAAWKVARACNTGRDEETLDAHTNKVELYGQCTQRPALVSCIAMNSPQWTLRDRGEIFEEPGSRIS